LHGRSFRFHRRPLWQHRFCTEVLPKMAPPTGLGSRKKAHAPCVSGLRRGQQLKVSKKG